MVRARREERRERREKKEREERRERREKKREIYNLSISIAGHSKPCTRVRGRGQPVVFIAPVVSSSDSGKER